MVVNLPLLTPLPLPRNAMFKAFVFYSAKTPSANYSMKDKKANVRTCRTENCQKQAVASKGLCHSCYAKDYKANRKLRVAAGTLEPIISPARLIADKSGYLYGYAPEHPLASNAGTIFEHRRVAYEKYGDGPHPCNWCDDELEWKVIQVDHLDWKRSNNDPDNLVVSCKTCNVMRKAPVVEQAARNAHTLRAMTKRLNR